jgi:OOP family OmpA-OmpF porin
MGNHSKYIKTLLTDETDVFKNVTKILSTKRIEFEKNKSKLLEESKAILDDLIPYLIKYKQYIIEVGGHTDTKGTKLFNQRLSLARAKAVRDYIYNKVGSKAVKLVIKGYGTSKPKYDNSTEEGRKLNRRVEFRIVN